MEPQILFVDDDENILSAYTRTLRKRYRMRTAQGGEEGLQILQAEGPFAVVVADMRMPGMDGIAFLTHVRNFNRDTVRIMLTGNADMGTAVEAVNQGQIFRFLTKPCAAEDLALVLDSAIEQYQLVTAERELLEQTLKGSVDLLVELFSTLDPASFGQAQLCATRAERIAKAMKMEKPWQVSMAAVLSGIGVLTIPPALMAKFHSGAVLVPAEQEIVDRVPEIGSNLLQHIPRMGDVARIIHHMNKNFDGTGYPQDGLRGTEIPLGSRILRVVFDDVVLESKDSTAQGVLSHLRRHGAWYDPEVVNALESLMLEDGSGAGEEAVPRSLHLKELLPGHTLYRGICTRDGLLVVPEGTVLKASHLEKMHNFARMSGLREPIWVIGPDPV